ncbi:hypothetical protein [Mucilaginibacter psychrotolerans]|uniref:Outer membrane protein beta-barrel domain-containing protein n=1 Tax=Mucilaginibacter psychrotolerans TaxID=1524096 RepID=A0A4Y8SE63_9SPHI|nr:hypothetical protein [Mucilaginibacter psychrotolerans]TFF36744.1 hypothetical protein E2R66_14955 [Mucilaginibacter psychrotolerans]
MKKYLFTAFTILFFAGTSLAQMGKGAKYIGGSFNLNYDEAGYSTYVSYPQGNTQYFNTGILNLNVSPEFGFFLNKHWVIGIQPGYARTSGTETNNYYSATNAVDNYSHTRKYHTDIIGLAINARYYWMLSDKFGIYPQIGISSNHVLNNFLVGSLNVGGGPNVVFFPTEKLGINMGFGNFNYNYNYQTNGSKINLALNNNFSFGLNYYWGGK